MSRPGRVNLHLGLSKAAQVSHEDWPLPLLGGSWGSRSSGPVFLPSLSWLDPSCLLRHCLNGWFFAELMF